MMMKPYQDANHQVEAYKVKIARIMADYQHDLHEVKATFGAGAPSPKPLIGLHLEQKRKELFILEIFGGISIVACIVAITFIMAGLQSKSAQQRTQSPPSTVSSTDAPTTPPAPAVGYLSIESF